jgi:hypothetical protein
MHQGRSVIVIAAATALLASRSRAEPFNFNIVPTESNLAITISAPIGFQTATDTQNSTVTGALTADLGLPAYSFKTAQLTTLDASLRSPITWNLRTFVGSMTITGTNVAFGIPGTNGTGVPGPAVPVALNGTFTQTGNLLAPRGQLVYSGTGLLSGISGNDDLSLEPPLAGDFAGTISQTGSTIRVSVPIDVTQTDNFQNGSLTVPVTTRFAGTIVATATTYATGWKVDANGDFSSASSWSGGTPDASTLHTAVFGPVNTSPRLITTSSASVRGIIFDSPQPYSVFPTPTSVVTLTIQDRIVARGGAAHRIAARTTSTQPLTIDVDAGTSLQLESHDNGSAAITKVGAGLVTFGRITQAGQLSITAGKVLLAAPSTTPSASKVTSLAIAAGTTLDLGDEALVVTSTTEATIRGLLNAGAIVTSSTAAGASVGYKSGFTGTFYGQATAESYINILTTRRGDATLDRTVNFDDLLALAARYNSPGNWSQGDFNYDGTCNFDDLLILAANYNQSLSAGDWAMAQASVPEPVSAVFVGGIAVGLLKRMRRN